MDKQELLEKFTETDLAEIKDWIKRLNKIGIEFEDEEIKNIWNIYLKRGYNGAFELFKKYLADKILNDAKNSFKCNYCVSEKIMEFDEEEINNFINLIEKMEYRFPDEYIKTLYAVENGYEYDEIDNISVYDNWNELIEFWMDSYDIPEIVRNYIDEEKLINDLEIEGCQEYLDYIVCGY